MGGQGGLFAWFGVLPFSVFLESSHPLSFTLPMGDPGLSLAAKLIVFGSIGIVLGEGGQKSLPCGDLQVGGDVLSFIGRHLAVAIFHFAEFERSIIRERINAGLDRARGVGVIVEPSVR